VGVCEKIELVTTARQSCTVSDTIWEYQRSCALDGAPVIRILCFEIGQRHIDLLICYLVALRVGAFSQMSKGE
jgi:hypothetical protein